MAGIFIGPYVDTRKEEANQRRLQHALLAGAEHESYGSTSEPQRPPTSEEKSGDLLESEDAALISASDSACPV